MSTENTSAAILLVHCADQPGLVAIVTQFIREHGGNVLDLDQHTDKENIQFFMRVAWEVDKFDLTAAEFELQFVKQVAKPCNMQWDLSYSDEKPRMALFVSKMFHCLYDILSRYQAGEWHVDIPLIISNHPDVESIAKQFGIDCHVFPVTAESKVEQEAKQLKLLSAHNIDLIVLARYMQVVSEDFISHYPSRIINIHHSFLPAFPGAKPYHSAYERGVKVIGATSHYVTTELDAGPIIEQDVVHVSHRDSVHELVRKGRDLEKLVLARAIWNHLQRKILVFNNRTVVFS